MDKKEKTFQKADEKFDDLKGYVASIQDDIYKANADSKEVIIDLLSKVGKLSFEKLPTRFNVKYSAFYGSFQSPVISVYYDEELKSVMLDTEEAEFEKLDKLQTINGGLFTYNLLRFIINYKEQMI